MIKVIVTENFTLDLTKFKQLKNIERTNLNKNGYLYKNDKFECSEELAKYLTGKNAYNRAFVEVIEVIPNKQKNNQDKKTDIKAEIKPKRRRKSIAKK